MLNILMSIHPKYANAINNAKKSMEMRKRFSINKIIDTYGECSTYKHDDVTVLKWKEPVVKVYMYSTSPEKEIIGYFLSDMVVLGNPRDVWDSYRQRMYIDMDDYIQYYGGAEYAYGICVKSGVNFTKNRPSMKFLKDNGISIPQSYQFLSDEQVALIDRNAL